MRVTKGGSMCANCKHLSDDKKHCNDDDFIAWGGKEKPAGSDLIPLPIDEYCSDWWKPKR